MWKGNIMQDHGWVIAIYIIVGMICFPLTIIFGCLEEIDFTEHPSKKNTQI